MHFFSKNLRYLRKKNHDKQADISAQVNKKQNTIGNWENGISEPNIMELTILCQYFGISLQELISSDLESRDMGLEDTGDKPDLVKNSKKQRHYNYEASNSMARDTGQDQFWIVIQELRRISEKLDSIRNSFQHETAEQSEHNKIE